MKWKLLSRVWLFATPWTVACQAPLSMGILQARILECVAMTSSSGSSQPRDQAGVSCIADGFFTHWATKEALPFLYLNKTQYEFYCSYVVFSSLFWRSFILNCHLTISLRTICSEWGSLKALGSMEKERGRLEPISILIVSVDIPVKGRSNFGGYCYSKWNVG